MIAAAEAVAAAVDVDVVAAVAAAAAAVVDLVMRVNLIPLTDPADAALVSA